uniref:Uncharacterized protein n=1 Tax=viral metagenome TaxID=1070528 RepID=A0A6C0EIV0_9ZZZZ
MEIDAFTQNTIIELNNIFSSKIYIGKYTYIDTLYNKSIEIIKFIIKHFEVISNKSIVLKESKHTNLVISILKNINLENINVDKNNPIYEFIRKLKLDKIPLDEIEKFINFNNSEINNIIEFELPNVDKSISDLLKIYSNNIISKFVPLNIQTDVLKNLKIHTKIVVKLGHIKLTFHFFSNTALDNNLVNIIIVKALYIIKLYNIDNIELTIRFFLSNIKKQIGLNDFLGRDEVNSGLTSFGLENTILIYRAEEIEKVLLHELVHALNIDNLLMRELDSIDKKIKCNFNINNKNDINFFEAYTESIAFITNIISNSILSGINYKILLENELRFLILQCSKILNFYNVKNIDKFFCKQCCFGSNIKWTEKSSILSYYFLKLGSVYNINHFINTYMFSKTIHNNTYYEFIINNFNNIEFIYHYKFTPTLRMTLYDFKWDFTNYYLKI